MKRHLEGQLVKTLPEPSSVDGSLGTPPSTSTRVGKVGRVLDMLGNIALKYDVSYI